MTGSSDAPGVTTDDLEAIRLRYPLDSELTAPVWPRGYVVRPFKLADARAAHALLTLTLQKEEKDFDKWWAALSGDAEFDPALWFVVDDPDGQLVAVAFCWTGDYLKYLAVHPSARRKGLAEALLWHVFGAFQKRGATRVDLKTLVVENANAIRLYRRIGMFEVDWNG